MPDDGRPDKSRPRSVRINPADPFQKWAWDYFVALCEEAEQQGKTQGQVFFQIVAAFADLPPEDRMTADQQRLERIEQLLHRIDQRLQEDGS